MFSLNVKTIYECEWKNGVELEHGFKNQIGGKIWFASNSWFLPIFGIFIGSDWYPVPSWTSQTSRSGFKTMLELKWHIIYVWAFAKVCDSRLFIKIIVWCSKVYFGIKLSNYRISFWVVVFWSKLLCHLSQYNFFYRHNKISLC